MTVSDGTIVGWFTPSGSPEDRRFIVWFNGSVEGSSSLAPMTSISVYGAGPKGLAVGMMQSGVEPPYPVMWQDGAYLDLPDEIVAGHGLIAGPNQFGVFTGYRFPSGEEAKDGRPFLWTPGGVIVTLPIPPGMLAAEGDAINAAGHVGGRAYLPPIDQSALGPWRPYFWNGHAAIELPMLPGATKATVFALNDVDQLVGNCTLPRNPSGATIWINDLPYSLHELASLPTSFQVTIASGINESGQVVANGSFNAAGTGVFTPVGVVPADVTLDCKVNERDIEKVIQSWGPVDSAVVRRADIDGNGVIDGFDLAEVLGAWTG
ncbi:MAG: dockerin type I domain-containing protein [Phycisphaerales bacterium]